MFEDFEKRLGESVYKGTKGIFFDEEIQSVQQSEDWFIKRLGMFTGSRIPDLMQKGKGSLWGAKANAYIMEKVVERSLSEDGVYDYLATRVNQGGKPAQWGIDNEDWARSEFAKVKKCEIIVPDFAVSNKIPFFGGSNDGKLSTENNIVEIKNPFDPKKHIENIKISMSGTYPSNGEYYGQIQANIEVAEADGCYFVSGDKRSKRPIAWVYVPRDEDYIEAMLERIKLADEEVKSILTELNF
jgi:hypothetical protein